MAQDPKRTGLGKGLGALIPGAHGGSPHGTGGDRSEHGEFLQVKVAEVFPNPDQPRRRFAPAALEELAASIREKGGVIQPIVVQRVPGGFQLVAGERRLRASRMAGLERIDAIVRRVAKEASLEDALIENIQRENLDAIEEAAAYREMMDRHGYTQEQVAKKVGKERATVANALRLLALPDFAREELVRGNITPGHARALLSLPTPGAIRQLLTRIVAKGLSVREAERLAARWRQPGAGAGRKKGAPAADPETAAVERRLERHFGTAVRVRRAGTKGPGGGGGTIAIAYHSLDELNGVLDKIFGRK
jgi:ParB family transcriptional regulator, chromosome partitioning protein